MYDSASTLHLRTIRKLKNYSAVMEYGYFLNGEFPDALIKIVNGFGAFFQCLDEYGHDFRTTLLLGSFLFQLLIGVLLFTEQLSQFIIFQIRFFDLVSESQFFSFLRLSYVCTSF